MLNSKGFDLWADGYDKAAGLSDEDGSYPFAGYKAVLNGVYNRVLRASAKSVPDIGFGTGTLTAKLYEHGCAIFGQDFSERMLELAQAKMPGAVLVRGDFRDGPAEPLRQRKYDAIIATYSLHHLTDPEKVRFVKSLLPLLREGGCLCIGDVAFPTRAALEKCKEAAGDDWDGEESYFVFDSFGPHFPGMTFEQVSPCAAILTLQNGPPFSA